MPLVVAPSPVPRSFMPINNSVIQRPAMTMSSMHPAGTQQATAQPVTTPATPPPTVQTVDTSSVPGNFQPF